MAFNKPTKVEASALLNLLNSVIDKCNSVLEIGPGVRPFQLGFTPLLRIYLEPSSAYSDLLNGQVNASSGQIIIRTDALTFLKMLPPNSFDSILCIDVIEHMTKSEGQELLDEMLRVARAQILVFTPLGFMPQHVELGQRDPWGLNEFSLQNHLSGWSPEDFPQDYQCFFADNFHTAEDGTKYGAILAIANQKHLLQGREEKSLGIVLVLEPKVSTLSRDEFLFEQILPTLEKKSAFLNFGPLGSGGSKLSFGLASSSHAKSTSQRKVIIGRNRIWNSIKIAFVLYPIQFSRRRAIRVFGFSRFQRLLIGGFTFREAQKYQLPVSVRRFLPGNRVRHY